MSDYPATELSHIRRHPERGTHEIAAINAIFDEAPICHIGFTTEEGPPVVIPTIGGRVDSILYLHGSPASRMLNVIVGERVCITTTIVDGIVLARSHFNSSLNFRSVVMFGTARIVTDTTEKLAGLEAITEHLIPGRWEGARLPTTKELNATTVLAVPIEEASAKVRTGPPIDPTSDLDLDHWAGVIPLTLTPGEPAPVEALAASTDLPEHLSRLVDPELH